MEDIVLLESFSEWFLRSGWWELGLLVLSLMAISVAVRVGERRWYGRLLQSPRPWLTALVKAISVPLEIIIWLFGVRVALVLLPEGVLPETTHQVLLTAEDIAILFLLVWFSLRFIKYYKHHFLEAQKERGDRPDQTLVHALGRITQILVFVIAGLILLHILGIPVSGVVAFGGFGGIATAFAAKDLLGNLFGGMIMSFDRPFEVGDVIRSPDKQIEGTVQYIGWRLTRILSVERRLIYVPNGLFLNMVVENTTRMTNRRIKTTIGIRYADMARVREICQAIESMLAKHADVDQTTSPVVCLGDLGESSIDILIVTYTKCTGWFDFLRVQSDVLLKAVDILHEHGADCAFPTRTLYLEKGELTN